MISINMNGSMPLTEWLVVVFIPAILFPMFFALAMLGDYLFGNSAVVLYLLYDSKSDLLNDFIRSYIASLPFSMITIWFVFLPLNLYFKKQHLDTYLVISLFGLIIGLILGIILYRLNLTGIILFSFTGLVFALSYKLTLSVLHKSMSKML